MPHHLTKLLIDHSLQTIHKSSNLTVTILYRIHRQQTDIHLAILVKIEFTKISKLCPGLSKRDFHPICILHHTARNHRMRMSVQHNIYPLRPGNQIHASDLIISLPQMRKHYHIIGALLPRIIDSILHHRNDIRLIQVIYLIALSIKESKTFRCHSKRSQHSHSGNFLRTDIHHHISVKHRLRAARLCQIHTGNWYSQSGQKLLKPFHTEIKLVIAYSDSIISSQIEDRNHIRPL